MMIDDAQAGQFDAVLQEHLELRQVINRIQCLLARLRVDGTMLRVALDELDSHLDAHFAHEEQGGYFVEVVDIAPRLKHEIDTLQRQHSLLLEMVGRLIDKANTSPLTTNRWKDIADDFERFVEHFIEHETDENDLLQRAYCQDIGEED